MPPWSFVVAQAVLAVSGLLVFRRRVLPGVWHLRQPQVILDVWGPLAVVAPLLFLTARIDGRMAGAGTLALSGPIACGLVGLGAALIIGRPDGVDRRGGPCLGRASVVAWAGTGVVLLLLAAAHELTIGLGQTMLAAGAVLLWMNTPSPEDGTRPEPEARRVGGHALVFVLLGLAQGGAVAMSGPAMVPIAAVIALAYGGIALLLAAEVLGARAAGRLSAWAATFGTLFGIGLLAFLRLLPRALELRGTNLRGAVVHGLAPYSVEAVALIVLGLAAYLLRDGAAGRRPARAAGIAVAILGVALAVWRVTRI